MEYWHKYSQKHIVYWFPRRNIYTYPGWKNGRKKWTVRSHAANNKILLGSRWNPLSALRFRNLIIKYWHGGTIPHRCFINFILRCQEGRGTMLRIFWSCPKISSYWREVRNIVQKFTDYKIPDDPAFFLIHVKNIPAKKYKKSILRHLLNAAKAYIPLNWKNSSPPTVECWLHKVEEINKMEDRAVKIMQSVYPLWRGSKPI